MGILYSGGLEDYTVLIPKEEGNYKWYFDNGGEREGTFREAFLQEDIMNSNPYKLNAGKFYMYELTSYSRQLNYEMTDGKKILLLRDSFATPVGAFLSQNVSHLDMLWNQYYSENELEEYLNGEVYDYIIVMLLPNNLNSKNFPFCVESNS
ncbi:hypothetical protein NXH76_20370 [Blautia schinkii]|nr:hypothetical protein [Blautia schinkii]